MFIVIISQQNKLIKKNYNFVLSFAMVCTLLAGVNVVAFAADDELLESVHTYYNDALLGGDGEHLFTKDLDEMDYLDSLPTWIDQGEEWLAPAISELAIYRCYNPNSGEHHYAAEDEAAWLVSQGWNREKVAFYSADEDDVDAIPVYRLWNGLAGVGSHYYTTDEGEAEYLAATGWTMEDISFYGYMKEEPSELEITAMQTGGSEATVLVTSDYELSALDDIVLTRASGAEVDSVVSISEDGKTATITTDSTLIAGEYTVTVTPADETIEPATATFTAEEAKLSAIAFVSDALILTDNTNPTTGMAAIRGIDQFGNAKILDSCKFYSAYDDSYNSTTGIVTLSTTGSAVFVVGTTVPVTAVYQDGTTVLQTQANLTVSSAQYISSMEFGEISTSSLSLLGERVTHKGLDSNSYYIPVKAKDQYGMDLTSDQLNYMRASAVGNTLILAPNAPTGAFAYVSNFSTLDDGTVVANIMDGALPQPGTATLSFISVGGGTFTTSFEIEDERWISSLQVSVPELRVGEEAELSLKAIDQYGEEFTGEDLYNVLPTNGQGTKLTFQDVNGLTSKNTTIEVGKGTLKAVQNPTKKTTKITYKPADKDTTTMIITTAAPETEMKTLTAKAASNVAGIQGLKEQDVLGGANDVVKITQSNITWVDTTGKEWTGAAPAYLANKDALPEGSSTVPTFGFTVTAPQVTKSSVPATTADGINVTAATDAQGKQIAGSEKYVIDLYSNDGTTTKKIDTKTVTVVTSDEDYKMYVAAVANPLTKQAKSTFYIGEVGLDTAVLAVKGVDSNGNVVTLGDSDYKAVIRNSKVGASNAEMTVSNDTVLKCGTSAAIAAGKVSGEITVDVYNDAGTEYWTSTTITCMNDVPETVAFVAMSGNDLTKLAPTDISGGITFKGSAAVAQFIPDIADAMDTLGHNDKLKVMGYQGQAVMITDVNPYTYYMVIAQDQYGMSFIDSAYVNADSMSANYPGDNVYNGALITVASDDEDIQFTVSQ